MHAVTALCAVCLYDCSEVAAQRRRGPTERCYQCHNPGKDPSHSAPKPLFAACSAHHSTSQHASCNACLPTVCSAHIHAYVDTTHNCNAPVSNQALPECNHTRSSCRSQASTHNTVTACSPFHPPPGASHACVQHKAQAGCMETPSLHTNQHSQEPCLLGCGSKPLPQNFIGAHTLENMRGPRRRR